MDKEIEAAVLWWARLLMKPPHHDNGDKSAGGVVTKALDNLVTADVTKPTEDQIRAFTLQLVLILREQANAGKERIRLGCDYGPCRELWIAAEHAGMDKISIRFPWKTSMKIVRGLVTVSLGYGASFETIYEA